MIYVCADDYGLNDAASARIRQCVECGAINKVSVFPNFGPVDLGDLQNVRLSLHLNLVEGRCMAEADKIPLLAHRDGRFRHTFIGLLKASLLHPKVFRAQVHEEIRAQVLSFRNSLAPGVPFCLDSHQHTHMIPAVFRAVLRVLREESLRAEYLRIPAEPLWPYVATPSLYHTYRPANLLKQWLLNGLWLVNKRALRQFPVPTADFFGILFSGHMDAKRVSKILPKYIKRANRTNRDIEVLFHPGYLDAEELDSRTENVPFAPFYLSKNRKLEFESVMKLSERSGL